MAACGGGRAPRHHGEDVSHEVELQAQDQEVEDVVLEMHAASDNNDVSHGLEMQPQHQGVQDVVLEMHVPDNNIPAIPPPAIPPPAIPPAGGVVAVPIAENHQYDFTKSTSFAIFFVIVAIFVGIYKHITDQKDSEDDNTNVSFVLLIGTISVSFAVGLLIQCVRVELHEDFCCWMFLLLTALLNFSVACVFWFCMESHGHLAAEIYLPVSLILTLLLWPLRYDRPQVLRMIVNQLLSLLGAAPLNPLPPHVLDLSYDFMKVPATIAYGFAVGIIYAVYEHSLKKVGKDAAESSEPVLPDVYVTVCFALLILSVAVGFILFVLVQSVDHHWIEVSVWSFLGLIVMLDFSLGLAILVCIYPHGVVPSSCFSGIFFLLLMVTWPCIFDRPEGLRAFKNWILCS